MKKQTGKTLKTKTILAAALVCGLVFTSTSPLFAQGPPTPDQLKKLLAETADVGGEG